MSTDPRNSASDVLNTQRRSLVYSSFRLYACEFVLIMRYRLIISKLILLVNDDICHAYLYKSMD
jgi:hypothetical protein